MSALAQAFELENALSRVFRAEAWLTEDIGRTIPIRLFRQGRRLGVEPVLDAVYSGMNKALRAHKDLPGTLKAFDKAFERAVKPRGGEHSVAIAELTKQRTKWQRIRTELLEKDRAGTEDLVAWLDRDLDERVALVDKLRKRKATGGASGKKAARKPTAVEQKLTKDQKKALALAKKRAEATDAVYEAFVDAAVKSRPDRLDSFVRLAAYFKHDDPVWERIADKVLSHREGKSMEDVSNAIQGVLGEALALRTASVVDSLVRASERAYRIAAKLGKDWEVVLTQAPVFASTKTGGLGEIYDASLWVVRKGKGDALEAAPVFALQVKSGTAREAAEQIGRDFSREVAGSVRLPAARAKPGEGATKTYELVNLNALLTSKGVTEVKGEIGGLTTQRILVSPRVPSTSTLLEHLPKGTSIEYVEGLMTKSEIQAVSDALRGRLK